jgi:serine/threonine protein phosphatase PrpC
VLAAKPASTIPCMACGELLLEDARFCEACGAKVGGGDTLAADGASSGSGTAAAPAPTAGEPCVKCQGPVAADGYCSLCGHKALEPVVVDDRGMLAYATHKGRRHERNEDSAALAATSEGWPVLVVSDGVSVSPNPHLASAAAVLAATSRLGGRPFTGPADLVAAVEDAQAAVCEVSPDGDPLWLVADGTHPSCTIVIAIATDTELHVTNVGDARAHLLTRSPGDSPGSGSGWKATQLTIDDSAAAQAIAEGIDADIALSLPGGHAITAWLGSDARDVTPHLAVHPLAAGDVALVTSDGLWDYAATDAALSDLVSTLLPPADELLADPGLGGHCEQLVTWAVDQGGADNVTVAITPAPVPDQRHSEQEEPA